MSKHVMETIYIRPHWEFRVFNLPYHSLFPGCWRVAMNLSRPRSHCKGTSTYQTREEAIEAAHRVAAGWEARWDVKGYDWKTGTQ